MSFISGTVSGVLGASAQNKATKTNMQIARETNEANLRMFQESRGSGGSSILPTYLEPGTEKVIANRAAAAAQAMFPDNPEMQLAQYQAILEGMRPTIQAGTRQIEDIYSGKLEAERAAERKGQVGSGDRSERIRTYNFPQGRVTDHRINFTLYKLDRVIAGEALDEVVDALVSEDQARRLAEGV